MPYKLLVFDDKTDIREGLPEFNKLVRQQKLFITYVSANNIEAVDSLFDGYMDMLDPLDITLVHNFTIELFSMLSNRFMDIGVNVFMITQGAFNYDSILELQDTKQIRSWGRSILDGIIKYVSLNRNSSEITVIQKAKEYIQANYNKDLSLEDVADHVFLSPAYFSRLFKQRTNETYTDYLIEIRIEKAMELLNDLRYKVYEVCTMLGYKNMKYFFRLFKQYTGYTPTEYRQNLPKRKQCGEKPLFSDNMSLKATI